MSLELRTAHWMSSGASLRAGFSPVNSHHHSSGRVTARVPMLLGC